MQHYERPAITPAMSPDATYNAGVQLGKALRSMRKSPLLELDLQLNVERPFKRFRQYPQIKAGFLAGYTDPSLA